jgi:hypothetical protein
VTEYDPETDYICINPAVSASRYNVVIMKYDPYLDGGTLLVFRCSTQLNKTAAEALAKSWAAATGLQVLS